MTTTLYRFYDAEDRLLYVGVAATPWWRWQAHRGTRWWEAAHHVALEHFQYREQAMAAEREAITSERPVFNRLHRASDVVLNQADRPYSADEIAEEFRAAHRVGRLPRGSMLPPVAEMASAFRASKRSVQDAMKILDAEGLLYGSPSRQWMVAAYRPVEVIRPHQS